MQFLPWGALSTVLVGLILPGFTVAEDANSRAQLALNALQNWYNTTSGLWNTCGWWNGANCMTVIADLAAIEHSVLDTAIYVFGNTLQNAPAYNPHPGPENKVQSRYEGAANASDWLDSAYDDDMWWALAWIAAYDVTNDYTYLGLAQDIFPSLVGVRNWVSKLRYSKTETNLRLDEGLGHAMWRWGPPMEYDEFLRQRNYERAIPLARSTSCQPSIL